MTRLFLLILLLTVVYSWEELKFVAVVIWSKISKQKTNYEKNSESDLLVADIVLIATIPMSLGYLLLSSTSLPVKLCLILVEFLFAGLLFKGLEQYRIRREFTKYYQGTDKIIAIGFSLMGLVSPSWNFATRTMRSTSQIGKYLFALSLPLASGLGLAIAVRNLGFDEFTSRLDQLIIIAVLGLILNVTIEILEHSFKSNKIRFSGYMRIVLGIVIIFALSAKLV